MYTIHLTIGEQESKVQLVAQDGTNRGQAEKVITRALATELLPTIDQICTKNSITQDEIAEITHESEIGETAITARAVRTIIAAWQLKNTTA